MKPSKEREINNIFNSLNKRIKILEEKLNVQINVDTDRIQKEYVLRQVNKIMEQFQENKSNLKQEIYKIVDEKLVRKFIEEENFTKMLPNIFKDDYKKKLKEIFSNKDDISKIKEKIVKIIMKKDEKYFEIFLEKIFPAGHTFQSTTKKPSVINKDIFKKLMDRNFFIEISKKDNEEIQNILDSYYKKGENRLEKIKKVLKYSKKTDRDKYIENLNKSRWNIYHPINFYSESIKNNNIEDNDIKSYLINYELLSENSAKEVRGL